jgi:rhomboid family GlyGly-CTERM serine protease
MTGLLAKKTSNHGRFFLPWSTAGIAALCIALFAWLGGMPEELVYDRQAIGNGDIWRLISGHLVHLDTHHLWLNLAAFVLLASGYEFLHRREKHRSGRLTGFVLAAMAGISASLYLLTPETLYYCGISAVLNALFASVCLTVWRRTKDPLWLMLLAGDLFKIFWEWQFGSVFSPGLTWPPHYTAHLTGLLIGIGEAALPFNLSPLPAPRELRNLSR